MEHRDFPALGRKVFFLNPPLSITNYVYDCLREAQYEVYFIKSHTDAKPILKMYPDALCFIFIDDGLSLRQWYNYIKSYEDEPELSSIFLGVLSSKIRPTDKEKFLMNLSLPGGFVDLGESVSEIYKKIKGILDVNGAMGKRLFLRLDCDIHDKVNGYFSSGFKLYPFEIQTISIAGFTCKIKNKMDFEFKKNMVIPNICINVGRRTVVFSAVVFEVRSTKKESIAILLFMKNSDKKSKEVVNNYIYEILTNRINRQMSLNKPDIQEYDSYTEKKHIPQEEQITSLEANEILSSIEELEELAI